MQVVRTLYCQVQLWTILIDKIEQISIAKLLAEAIIRIHEKRPLSPLFEIGNAKKS